MRPTCPKDDNHGNVDKHRDDDNDDNDDDHHGAVETIAGEIDGDNCYLALGGRNNHRRDLRGQLLPGNAHWKRS